MGITELTTNVSLNTGIPRGTCKRVLDGLIDEITNALYTGEVVKIKGLMTMELSKRSERTVRDLNTGEFVTYPELKTVKCKMSKQVKDIINERGM